MHGLRDKEPQEIPILPYSGTVRSLSRPKNRNTFEQVSLRSSNRLRKQRWLFERLIRTAGKRLWILTQTQICSRCARKERKFVERSAPLSMARHASPSETSIRRNIDTPLTLPHLFCAVCPLRSLACKEIFFMYIAYVNNWAPSALP